MCDKAFAIAIGKGGDKAVSPPSGRLEADSPVGKLWLHGHNAEGVADQHGCLPRQNGHDGYRGMGRQPGLLRR
jgi:hypothetical protein